MRVPARARGHTVDLFEMRPVKMTAAHQTSNLAELVCSNSFRSSAITNAVGLLKHEMSLLGSLVIALRRGSARAGRRCIRGRPRAILGRGHRRRSRISRASRLSRRGNVSRSRRLRLSRRRHRTAHLARRSSKRSTSSSAATACTSTTRSRRSWPPIRSTCRSCTGNRATEKDREPTI